MKLLFKMNGRLVISALMLAGVFISCDKDQGNGVDIDPASLSVLTIRSVNISDHSLTDLADAGKQGRLTRDGGSGSALKKAMVSTEDFDVLVSEGRYQPAFAVSTIKRSKSTGGSGQKAELMGGGIKYRLLLYEVNNGQETFWRSKEMTSNTSSTADTISVVKNKRYNWYAYSYNDNNPIAEVVDRVTPVIPMGANKDFMVDKGFIEITETGNTPLSIVFQRKTARVGVEFDARGMFSDNIQTLTVTAPSALFTTGNYNLKGESVVAGSTATYNPGQITLANFQNVETNHADRKVAYFHTITNAAVPNFSVTLNSLAIQLDNTSTRAFNNINQAFQLPGSLPVAIGATSIAKFDLVESPLTISGVRWARANLYYHINPNVTNPTPADTLRNAYRFHHLNKRESARTNFWRFLSITPVSTAETGDPCLKVHPEGVWKTPSYNQMAGLVLATNPKTYSLTNGSTGTGDRYTLFTNPGSTSPYYSGTHQNQLKFYLNGHIAELGAVLNIIEINFSLAQQGVEGHYWSESPLVDLGIGDLGRQFFETGNLLNLGGILGRSAASRRSTALLNISAIGASVLESPSKNVRCVRSGQL